MSRGKRNKRFAIWQVTKFCDRKGASMQYSEIVKQVNASTPSDALHVARCFARDKTKYRPYEDTTNGLIRCIHYEVTRVDNNEQL